MSDLFSPLDLRGVRAPNRVMVSPMCQYSCEPDGLATDWHLVHLGSRATGGAGIVMTEATAVEPRGRISPNDLGLWSDDHAAALEPLTAFLRDQGAVPAVQLAHAGRKGSKTPPWDGSEPLQPDEDGYEVVAPSDRPYPIDGQPPQLRAMTEDDVADVVDAFADAAVRAVDAGFEVVEVHAAHGYLLHEFLSPVTNRREDAYGGDLAGRTRIVRETVDAVRDAVGDDVPVFLRVSATDWLPDRDSWTVDDTVRLANDVADQVDLVDVSAGGLHPDQQLPGGGPGYQVPYAEAVNEGTPEELLVGAVGGITAPEHADAIVRNDRADLAILGREHLRDPYFALHAADALDADEDGPEWPIQYRRAVTK
jgi:2,4-dienoyl-CoA reductase-like NADH-dependent reductase (Old Yellow Enzyme family)